MNDDSATKSTKVVAAPPPTPNATARERFEKKVAAAVVIHGFAVSRVAEKFGIPAEEVREIFERRCPGAMSESRRATS